MPRRSRRRNDAAPGKIAAENLSILPEHHHPASIETNQIKAKWRIAQKRVANQIHVCQAWSGWLQKQGHVAGWQPRWFQLRLPHPALDGEWVDSVHCAVLVYQSDGKGEVPLYIEDVRRERWQVSGDGVAFSVGLIQPPAARGIDVLADDKQAAATPSFLRWAFSGRRRMRLMATSDLDAVAFLISLRRMLHPESAMPTPHEAVHSPAQTLRKLF